MKKLYKILTNKNAKYTDNNNKLNRIIYSKGTKTKNSIIKNISNNNSILQIPHIVCKINYPVVDCELPKP